MADDRQYDCSCTLARGGYPQKRGCGDESLGRSRGGFTTKIHAACDSFGNPLPFILTGGHVLDYKQVIALIGGMKVTHLLADKWYDADYVSEVSQAMRAVAMIPPKSNCKIQHDYDKYLHKKRNLIELMFNKLKHFSRIATRYDKRAISFLSFLYLDANEAIDMLQLHSFNLILMDCKTPEMH